MKKVQVLDNRPIGAAVTAPSVGWWNPLDPNYLYVQGPYGEFVCWGHGEFSRGQFILK